MYIKHVKQANSVSIALFESRLIHVNHFDIYFFLRESDLADNSVQ